jgi:hypothetical protein
MFKTLKFWISPIRTKIVRLTFEISDIESESQQITLQLNESKVFYLENFVSLVKYHKLL